MSPLAWQVRVAVGDRRQSIYGWRGADTEAIPNLIDRLGAATLPLSISYRCPRRHVELARLLAPQIAAAPGAPEGVVRTIAEDRLPEITRPGDLIICRTNAPLVECVFKLLQRGIRAVISGKDRNLSLQSLAREVKGDTMSERRRRLEAWHGAERQRLIDCEARANTGNDVSRFSIDWKPKGASCPQGQRSVK